MKRLLSINTASAGTLLVIPDYMDVEGIVALQYLDETTLRQRDAAAHYLLDQTLRLTPICATAERELGYFADRKVRRRAGL